MMVGRAESFPSPARQIGGDYRRRGGCPGLFTPIETGDGLLVRVRPRGTIPLAAFDKLAAAALEHGNGIVEVTARGAIQVRGLSGGSAPRFAAAVAAVPALGADDGIAILTDPLAGVAAHELLDALEFADALRGALAGVAPRLSRKISVAVDGGGTPGLDCVAADIRLRAVTAGAFRLSVDGDAESATGLGLVGIENAAEAVTRLLEVVAQAERGTRVRDILRLQGPARLASRIADLFLGGLPDVPQRRSEAVGPHALSGGAFACGVGLPFGHATAAMLQVLNRAARGAGACGWRTAPRTLLAIGLAQGACGAFAGEAASLHFIVRADDPRRRVIACAGAPACSGGHIAARALAPRVAAAAAPFVGAGSEVHVSGCAKGCAHPAPAALTIVGTADGCALVANGTARERPYATVAAAHVPAAVVNAMREHGHA